MTPRSSAPTALIYINRRGVGITDDDLHRTKRKAFALAKARGYRVLRCHVTDADDPNAFPAMIGEARREAVDAVFIPHAGHVGQDRDVVVREICALVYVDSEITLPRLNVFEASREGHEVSASFHETLRASRDTCQGFALRHDTCTPGDGNTKESCSALQLCIEIHADMGWRWPFPFPAEQEIAP